MYGVALNFIFETIAEDDYEVDIDLLVEGDKNVAPIPSVNAANSITRLIKAHQRRQSVIGNADHQDYDDQKEFYPTDTQVNQTMNELEEIIKECTDEATKKKLENVYARVYHSVYVVDSSNIAIPYSVLLEKRRSAYERKMKLLEAKQARLKEYLQNMVNTFPL